MALEDLDKDEEEEESKEVEVLDEGESESISAPVPGAENTLVSPVDDIDRVVDLYDQFEEIKEKLLDKEDTTIIQGRPHVNKSGWRKIATAFNLSVEIVEQELWIEDDIVKARVKARATAPNGKVSTEISMCASNETTHMEKIADGSASYDDAMDLVDREIIDLVKVDNAWRAILVPHEVNEHNIIATAATRAKNRAISDCVGGGEVSSEEISAEDVF